MQLYGHEDVAARVRGAIARGRISGTYLFVGPAGIGKRAFAERMAQALLCPQAPAEQLAPCGQCDSCRQVISHTHPDLILIEKPADKSSIPLAMFVGDDDHRMRQGLCHDIALKPFMGGRKIAIIDDADYLNEESANALLKTLEEPPPGTVMILIGTSADRQLPTIRSRSQIVRFAPLADELVSRILQERGLVADRARADRLAEHAEGSVERAMELTDEALWEFRTQLLTALAQPRIATVPLAAELVSFVEAAGKEAPLRRARARQVVGFAVEFCRQVLRAECGLEVQGDPVMQQSVSRAQAAGGADIDATTARIERSLEALGHIDRNAHQTMLLESWLHEYVGAATRG